MQKWLPLTYSLVRIQNSLTNLVQNNKFFTVFVSKTRLEYRTILYRQPFLHRVYDTCLCWCLRG